MMDDDILSVVSDALNSLVDRVEALEARVDGRRKREPKHAIAIPGKFPWPTKHPTMPDVKLTQPVVTVER